ncbi:ABC transporter permease [candidate division KSB1 bacterium]
MFRNYLKIFFRNVLRHKAYSFINIAGLAIGIACFLLILLYVQNEFGYDDFHVDTDRIYRTSMTTPQDTTRGMGYPRIPGGMAQRFMNDYPEIETSVRLFKQDQAWLRREQNRFLESDLIFADSTFFSVFSYPLVNGDAETALDEPYSVLLTESMAEKYFGTEDPVGGTIEVEMGNLQYLPLRVTGVLKDIPSNTHLHFNVVLSMSTFVVQFNNPPFLTGTQGTMFLTYIKLRENTDPEALEADFPAFVERHHSVSDRTFTAAYFLQPLQDIHLHSNLLFEFEQNGNYAYVLIMTLVAFFMLIIACINFMNLATARSAKRAREVGIRKVVGAFRLNLIKQFMGESTFITFISLIIALGSVLLILPYFNQLTGKDFTTDLLFSTDNLLIYAALLLFVGIFSGSYPALFLSAFRPVDVLKGKGGRGSGRSIVRKILVVFQFAVSISFISATIIILAQINYIKTRDLGFDRFKKITIPLDIPASSAEDFLGKRELLKEEFLKFSGVESATVTSGVPTQLRQITFIKRAGASDDTGVQTATVAVDPDYIPSLNIEILEGHNFSEERQDEWANGIILNETTADQLGIESPYEGQQLVWRNGIRPDPNNPEQMKTVIGVVKDLHFEPLHREIAPMIFMVNPGLANQMLVKFNSENVMGVVENLEAKWSEIVTERPMRHTFLDDDFNILYMTEYRLSDVLSKFTILVIFIACLGLFGLASFTAEQRTKEIGIRKVLGASVGNIVWHLSKEFSILVIIANMFAWPAAWFFAHDWLGNFYYRIGLNPMYFVLAGLAALAIALFTVCYQAIKAALSNPVDALHYE